jgi:hypothetical protein
VQQRLHLSDVRGRRMRRRQAVHGTRRSQPICAFIIPNCHCLPLRVCFISGSAFSRHSSSTAVPQ